jgi:hypothetical protein
MDRSYIGRKDREAGVADDELPREGVFDATVISNNSCDSDERPLMQEAMVGRIASTAALSQEERSVFRRSTDSMPFAFLGGIAQGGFLVVSKMNHPQFNPPKGFKHSPTVYRLGIFTGVGTMYGIGYAGLWAAYFQLRTAALNSTSDAGLPAWQIAAAAGATTGAATSCLFSVVSSAPLARTLVPRTVFFAMAAAGAEVSGAAEGPWR